MDDKEKLFRTIDATFHDYAEQYLDDRIPILSRETIVRALWTLYERGRIRLVPDENSESFTLEWRRERREEVFKQAAVASQERARKRRAATRN